jgi:hypothetical protein
VRQGKVFWVAHLARENHRLEVSNVELERQSRFARLGRRKHDFADRVCKTDGDWQPVVMPRKADISLRRSI